VETIGSKRSYALIWCMPNNDDDDDIGKHSIPGNLCLPVLEKSGNFMWSGKWSPCNSPIVRCIVYPLNYKDHLMCANSCCASWFLMRVTSLRSRIIRRQPTQQLPLHLRQLNPLLHLHPRQQLQHRLQLPVILHTPLVCIYYLVWTF